MNINKHIRGIRFSFTFISLAVLLAATSLAAIANAQNPEESQTTPPTDVTATTTDGAGDATTTTETMPPAALSETAQDRIHTLAESMSTRMEAAHSNLSDISNRARLRIDHMAENGADAALARLHLDNANTALTDAATQLTTARGTIDTMLVATDPLPAWATAKTAFQNTKTKLQTAHQSLRNVVTAIQRATQPNSEPTATDTPLPENPLTGPNATDTSPSIPSTSTATTTE